MIGLPGVGLRREVFVAVGRDRDDQMHPLSATIHIVGKGLVFDPSNRPLLCVLPAIRPVPAADAVQPLMDLLAAGFKDAVDLELGRARLSLESRLATKCPFAATGG